MRKTQAGGGIGDSMRMRWKSVGETLMRPGHDRESRRAGATRRTTANRPLLTPRAIKNNGAHARTFVDVLEYMSAFIRRKALRFSDLRVIERSSQTSVACAMRTTGKHVTRNCTLAMTTFRRALTAGTTYFFSPRRRDNRRALRRMLIARSKRRFACTAPNYRINSRAG
jgi:hypothetical protein